MRTLLTVLALAVLAVLALPVPLSAQERIPSWAGSEVPDPIPADICIEVHWSEASRTWKEGTAISIHHPPLDAELRSALENIRHNRKGSLVRCSAGDV